MAEVTEKDYERMTWLHCVLEKMPEHCMYSKLYCAVGQECEDRICGMKHFICARITGLGNQKLAMSWTMPSLALLLHIVLSMTV